MKFMHGLLFVALAMAGFAAAAPADDTREIERVERELLDAFRAGDAATIEKLEDETWTPLIKRLGIKVQ